MNHSTSTSISQKQQDPIEVVVQRDLYYQQYYQEFEYTELSEDQLKLLQEFNDSEPDSDVDDPANQ